MLQQNKAALEDQKKTLEQQKTTLEQDNAGLKQQIASLEQKNTAMQEQVGSLEKEKSSLVAASEQRQQQYDALVQGLSKEVEKGQLQVKQYKNMLAVDLAEQIFFDSGRAALKKEGKEVLKKVAEALLEHETIDGEDIDRLVKGLAIERPPPSAPPRAPLPVEDVKEKRPGLFGRPVPVLKGEPEKA